MKTMQVHKIASATIGLRLDKTVTVTTDCTAVAGNAIVVEALHEKTRYDQLELTTGRNAKISRGDIIIGVLGTRRALRGFCGEVPETIHLGDTLHILNLGGVIGTCTSENPDLGAPHQVRVLGMVTRDTQILNIADAAIPLTERLQTRVPIVLISGTCMSSGKTLAACSIVEHLSRAGSRVAAAKLTGIACLRDTLAMEDHGAFQTLSFLDCGLPSTADFDSVNTVAISIVNALSRHSPDVIVIEMGDGILGSYGVEAILDDADFQSHVACHVVCANDPVGAWGARELMQRRGLPIHVLAGPATDNEVGCRFVTDSLGVRPANAKNDPAHLGRCVQETLA